MNLSEKKQIVEDLHGRLSKSQIVILTDYKGMDVSAITQLRQKLQEAGVEYQVVKNTLLVRASEDTDAALIKEHLKGPSAIAYSYDDPVAPAKILTEFAKSNKKLEIKAGAMSGKVLDISAISALSELPSREVLLGQVLAAMNAVPASFVRTLNEVPRSLVGVLNAIREQKETA